MTALSHRFVLLVVCNEQKSPGSRVLSLSCIKKSVSSSHLSPAPPHLSIHHVYRQPSPSIGLLLLTSFFSLPYHLATRFHCHAASLPRSRSNTHLSSSFCVLPRDSVHIMSSMILLHVSELLDNSISTTETRHTYNLLNEDTVLMNCVSSPSSLPPPSSLLCSSFI